MQSTRTGSQIAAIGAALVLGLASMGAPAQEPVRVRVANLGFPSHTGLIINVLKDRGFDKKHGLNIEIGVYGTINAYYGSLASGETDVLAGGPLVFQKMRLEGVPVKMISSLVDMTSLSVITKDPAIKSINDLKGKTIAADMGSAEYSVLNLYAKRKGITLGKDITVVQAGPPLVRTQLAADRVEAGMTWEPTATLTMRDNAGYRIILNGKQAWQELTGKDGWLLAIGAREDFIAKNAAALPRLVAAFEEASRYMRSNADESDKIIQQALKFPPGAFKDMILAPRVVSCIASSRRRTPARARRCGR